MNHSNWIAHEKKYAKGKEHSLHIQNNQLQISGREWLQIGHNSFDSHENIDAWEEDMYQVTLWCD